MVADPIVNEIAIYGAGGFGKEVAWLIQSCNLGAEAFKVVCFIDDDTASHGSLLNCIPVMGLLAAREQFPRARAVVAVGLPRTRQLLAEKAETAGFEFATLIHPRVEHSEWVEVGSGTVICAGSILTTNIKLGRHVHINLDCTVGHDVVMGDYTTLTPGVHVSGYVHLGKRVFVGTGAVIVNGTKDSPITIGDDAVVGAGACVTKPVPERLMVAGIPAKPMSGS